MSATESQFAALSEYDFVVAIDRSGSMDWPVSKENSRRRWDAVQEAAITFAKDVEKIDSDGLGLVIFGGADVQSYDGVTADKLVDIFATHKPRGGTPLAEALQAALKLAGKSDKKDFIVVFTDGEPDDKKAAAKVIIEAANQQTSDEALTILFVQVGDDAGATAYLKSLDDDLKGQGAKFDIVDAKTVAEVDKFPDTVSLIVAAIND